MGSIRRPGSPTCLSALSPARSRRMNCTGCCRGTGRRPAQKQRPPSHPDRRISQINPCRRQYAYGSIEGYAYSPALKNSGLIWDETTFTDYTRDPKAKIPGTKMVYAGLKDEQRMKDL